MRAWGIAVAGMGGVDDASSVVLLLIAWRHLRIIWMRENPTKAHMRLLSQSRLLCSSPQEYSK